MVGFRNQKRGVYAFLTSETDTTVTTGGTFQAIAGTFTNEVIEGFHLDTDKLMYDGEDDIQFEIDWHASFSSEDAGRTIHFGINHNSETLTSTSSGVVGTYAKNADQVYSVSGTRVVTLNSGDTIQLQLTSDTDSDVVSVVHFTTTMTKFFRGV